MHVKLEALYLMGFNTDVYSAQLAARSEKFTLKQTRPSGHQHLGLTEVGNTPDSLAS